MVDVQTPNPEMQMTDQQKLTRKWLASHFMPYVMVQSSLSTQKKMMANGLTPAEFLRPFGDVGNLGGYAMRTNDKNEAVKLANFRINFIDAPLLNHDQKQSAKLTDLLLRECQPTQDDKILSLNREQAQEELYKSLGKTRKITESEQTPWFTKWKQQFLAQYRFQTHELTQQPVSFIYMISVEDEDPLGTITNMRKPENQPQQYRNQVYDNQGNTTRSFIFVLNDRADSNKCSDTIMALRGQFSTNIIYEIKMSGQFKNEKPPIQDMWKKHKELDENTLRDPNAKYGKFFLKDDRDLVSQNVRKVIEMHLVPFIANKIQQVAQNIYQTRRKTSAVIAGWFKSKAEPRNDSDGLKEGFKMNKSELEIRGLVDLAYVMQDYETVRDNIDIAINDFKKIQAHKHSIHCQEMQLFSRMVMDRNYLLRDFKEFQQTANQIFELYQLKAANPSVVITKFTIYMAEIYQDLGKYKEAADIQIRIATILNDNHHVKPLFFEQAAYEFLYLKQYRKFAFYMQKAANYYKISGLKNYHINCLTILHPFYQTHTGWNQIQNQIFTQLGKGAQNSQEKSVNYFKNLLELAHQFTDAEKQNECLRSCLDEFGKFPNAQGQLGQFPIPKIQAHTIEVFIESESLASSNGNQTLKDNIYRSTFLGGQNNQLLPNTKAEMNTNFASWKLLEKKLTDWIKNHEGITNELSKISIDEESECVIYDAVQAHERQALARKRVRKVFAGQPITVKFRMTNSLLTEVMVTNLKLVAEGVQYSVISQNIRFNKKSEFYITLKLTPLEPGEILIKRIEWDLFEKFKCCFDFQLEPKLNDYKNIFLYKVEEMSSEIEVDINLNRDMSLPLIQSETSTGKISLKPTRSIKNLFLICSHTNLFGFQTRAITDLENLNVDLQLRATKVGDLNVKFLLRYEVVDAQTTISRFRFKRIELNLEVKELFQLVPSFHLSKKVSDQVNTQLETRMIQLTNYANLKRLGKPKITQIRIVQNDVALWHLQKKESQVHFFVLQRGEPKPESQILSFAPETPGELNVINEQIAQEQANLTSDLNLIVVWQLGQIRGYYVLPNLRPIQSISAPPGADSAKNDVKPKSIKAPIITFDFPKQVSMSKAIQLTLHLQNQGEMSIEVELSLNKHDYFMWIGKSKHICQIEPEGVERITLNAMVSQKGYIDLNQFAITWKGIAVQRPISGNIKIQDQLIVEVKEN